MLLCDIGNTSYHFLNGMDDYKEDVISFNPSNITTDLFYICVNPHVKNILKDLPNWIDLSLHVDMKNYYDTMGIDRIIACEAIRNGVIIDAGSAITVDVVKNGIFEGGFIYPGIDAMSKSYKNISTALEYSFNFELDLHKLPKNSQDAISYGYLKTLYSEVVSYDMNIYLTGGDSTKLKPVFKDAEVDEMLIFKGMKEIISKI